MTFTMLRSLHAIIGDALDEVEQIYHSQGRDLSSSSTSAYRSSENASSIPVKLHQSDPEPDRGEKSLLPSISLAYASPPPSPLVATCAESVSAGLDFPSLDSPFNPTSPSEALTAHPTVTSAISRIIAAAGQLSASMQTPFLTICDATMGYHLPSCMRLLEASHVVELLREAGPQGLHVDDISRKNGVDAKKLAHILRLLATHHILREVSPDVFTLNRISSVVDSGKSFADLRQYQADGRSELKYMDTNGIAAFVGLCTDELQKSAAYMTETYYLSPSEQTRAGTDPTRAPFCFAFDTAKDKTGFFGWLEGEVQTKRKCDDSFETGPGSVFLPFRGISSPRDAEGNGRKGCQTLDSTNDNMHTDSNPNPNRFRLERFGKAMSGTDGWETPGGIFNGFDWHSLPSGGIVVDVGGGIGSTSMLLATAFSSWTSSDDGDGLDLKFVIQDRPFVCEMGEKAWIAKCPELLGSVAEFQVHDFFTPQPVKNADLFLLRVVLHDWPDDFARRILFHLREAAAPSTKLLIADFVLPLACRDSMADLEDVEGAESLSVPAPLLPNLGKGSASVYWMDLTMQVIFNSQERTLRELVTLSASAGWKVTKVSRTVSSFGYLVAVPMAIPEQVIRDRPENKPRSMASRASVDTPKENNCIPVGDDEKYRSDLGVIERSSSRCGTPTFGSNMKLSSVQEALTRFGGGLFRKSKGMSKKLPTPSSFMSKEPAPVALKPALTLSSPGASSRKKSKPSPLSIVPVRGRPSSPGISFLQTPSSSTLPPSSDKILSPTPLGPEPSGSPSSHSSYSQKGQPITHSPAPKKGIPRRLSLANLRLTSSSQSRQAPPPVPTFSFTRQPLASPSTLQPPSAATTTKPFPRRLSHAHLSHAEATAAAAQVEAQTQATLSQGQGLLTPSFIPIRANAESSAVESGGITLARSGSNFPSSSLLAPVTPQRTTTPRKSSFAQLSVPSFSRTRSGTVTGGGNGGRNVAAVTVDRPSSQSPGWGSRKLDFFSSSLSSSPVASTSKNKKSKSTTPSSSSSPARTLAEESLVTTTTTTTHGSEYICPEFGTGGGLAAAARIEKGKFHQDNEIEGDDT